MKLTICLSFCVAALFLFSTPLNAQSKKTIILVRHAEKDASTDLDETGDVDLSAEGRERAIRLMKAIKRYKPREIFSTDYKRTQQTAEPIARLRGETIQIYDTAKLADLVTKILTSTSGRYLVVGHSNTTPALANLFMKKEIFKDLPDTEYGVIWVIRMKNGVVSRVEIRTY